MRTEGKVSKVAVCRQCNKIILACHTESLSEDTEKEFTELTNEDFLVQIETIEETRARKFGSYKKCINECKTKSNEGDN